MVDERGKPSEFIKFIASHKMPALAMTDHGNMHGAIEFYNVCQSEGIKPIIGMEAYVAPKSRFERSGTLSTSNNHLTLLAKNEKGYLNLMKLTSLSYLEGFYYKPRVDWELLEKYHEGLIALSGCLKSKVAQTVLEGQARHHGAKSNDLGHGILAVFFRYVADDFISAEIGEVNI